MFVFSRVSAPVPGTFRFSRAITLVAMVIGILLLQGCAQRPTHSAVYHGRVLDSDSRKPVRSAKVKIYTAVLTTSSKSKEDGRFDVGPLRCFHVGVVIPPEPHLLPGCKHDIPPNVFLMFSKHGYQPQEILVPQYGTNWSHDLDVGDVLLKARESTKQ